MKIKQMGVMIVLAIVFLVLFKNHSAYSDSVRGVTDTTIKVGTVGDLTGPIATTWLSALQSLKTYFRYVNERGGVHGRKVVNMIEDDRYSIPMALSAFKKLVFRDRVLILFAASGVGHTHAIIPLAEKNRVPMIAQTNDWRYFKPARRYIFTALPFYEDQVELIFEYIFKDLKRKNPTIAVAYTDTASGHISRDTCRKMTTKYGVRNYVETIISVGAGDFTSQILHLKRSKPDYVIIHGYISNTAALLRDAYKFKFNSTFIVIQYGTVDDTIKLAGVAAKGLIGVSAFPGWNDESPGMKKLRKIVMKYYPETKMKNRTYLNGWFASTLIHNALENAGRGLTPETVVEGFEKIQNFDTKGICGVVSYGPDDHKAIDYNRFYEADLEKERFVPITDWRKPKK